jgi:hypothetical protein
MLSKRNKTGLLIAAGLALSGITLQSAAAAPVVCGERQAFTEALKGKFKEERQALGLVATSSVVELYVSPGGSWTVLMTGVDGKSCVLATGHSWETSTPKAAQSSL